MAFFDSITKAFGEAGVALVALPNLKICEQMTI